MNHSQDSLSRRLGPVFAEVAAKAPQQEAQEPVAWLEYAKKRPGARWLVFTKTSDKELSAAGWVAEPLYLAPPAKAQPRMTMEQHKAEYRSRPLGERLNGVFTETANPPEQSSAERALQRVTARLLAERTNGVSAKAYKPTHGGYPG